MKAASLIGLAVYLGIGAMFHAVFVGSHFDWSSAWTFGWLLGWPIAMMLGIFAFSIAACLVMLPIIGIMGWNERRHADRRALARRMRL